MKLRRMANFLLPRVQRIAERRPPDFVVNGGQMLRWYLIPRNPILNVYLHRHLEDDADDMHDHMYASVSFVLSNGLIEHFVEEARKVHNFGRRLSQDDEYDLMRAATRRQLWQGQVIPRSSRMAHKLSLYSSEAWTIFVTGPRVKQWGFWCKQGFRHWKDYVERRGTGNGCEA